MVGYWFVYVCSVVLRVTVCLQGNLTSSLYHNAEANKDIAHNSVYFATPCTICTPQILIPDQVRSNQQMLGQFLAQHCCYIVVGVAVVVGVDREIFINTFGVDKFFFF